MTAKKLLFSLLGFTLALVLLFGGIPTVSVAAESNNDLFANFTSKSTLLMHADSGQVLYAKNEHQKMQVASISKLMTTLLTLEKVEKGQLKLDDKLTASAHACSMEGSQAFLDENSQYLVKDLLKSVIVASANDSAVVLAESIGGSESSFANMMNKRAKELGMNNTKYANATGLPSSEQYSTAYDTALILKEVGKYDVFNQDSKIWMDKFIHPSGRETELVNTNRLIKYYTPCVNGKTGFTDEAGYCLASSATSNGLNLIAVTLNCNNASNRFKESMDLFNYGFANYENKQVLSCKQALPNNLQVLKGKETFVLVAPQTDFFVVNKKGEEVELKVTYDMKANVTAPINAGQVVGKAIVTKQGKVVGEVNIVATKTVEKQTFGNAMKQITKQWSF